MSVFGSRVASQASVPHQDFAHAISLFFLWSQIGSAIGNAVAAVIWSSRMPDLLRTHVPDTATEADVTAIFMRVVRNSYEFGRAMRAGAVMASRMALYYYCLAPALGLAFIPLIASFF